MFVVPGAPPSAVRTVAVASVVWRRRTNSPACASPLLAKRPAGQAPRAEWARASALEPPGTQAYWPLAVLLLPPATVAAVAEAVLLPPPPMVACTALATWLAR